MGNDCLYLMKLAVARRQCPVRCPKTGKLTVLDAGLVTAVEDDAFLEFGDFIRALVSSDIPMIAETLVVLHDQDSDASHSNKGQ